MFMDLQAQQLADALIGAGTLGTLRKKTAHEAHAVHYDPYQSPPNFDLAQTHGKAKRVYHFPTHEEFSVLDREECPCCGIPEDGHQIPLSAPLSQLYPLGSGYALYFKLLLYCIGLLCIMFVISGFYNMASSVVENDCEPASDATPDTNGTANNQCVQDYVSIFTIANKKDDVALLTGQMVLNLIAVIAMGIFFQYMRYQLRKMHIAADDQTVTPGDYTIKITGKGMEEEHTDQQIKEWIEAMATEEHPLKVVKVHRTFDVAQYVDLKNKKDVLETLRRQVFNFEKKHNIEIEAQNTASELEQLRQNGLKPTDTVLVTFDKAEQAAFIEEEYTKVRFDSWTDYVTAWFGTTSEVFHGKEVFIERAPEPTDFLWENLAFSSWERFKKRSVTKLFTLLLIVVSFGLIILINWGQGEAREKYGPKSHVVQVFSGSASVIIVAINTILSMVVRILTAREKHPTYTSHFTAIAEKLCVAQFLNTALTTLVAQIILYNQFSELGFINGLLAVPFYGKGGMVENMFFVFISNAFLTPIMNLFDPGYFFKLYKRKKALKQGDKSVMTQKEAHQLFEEPEMDLAVKNALLVKTMLLTAFFAPVIPFSLIFAIVGLTFNYWVDKYLLLRRNVLPIALQNELCVNMIENIEWMGLMFGLGNLIFVLGLQNAEGVSVYETISKGLVYAILGLGFVLSQIPSEALNDKFLPIVDEVTEFNTYDGIRLEFTTDYDLQNPVTNQQAMEEHAKLLEEKKNFVPKMRKNVRRGLTKLLENKYAHTAPSRNNNQPPQQTPIVEKPAEVVESESLLGNQPQPKFSFKEFLGLKKAQNSSQSTADDQL